MTAVAFGNEEVEVDAGIIARGLGIEESLVQPLIRRGEITGRQERGVGEDAGRSRLTFFHGNRRFRLVFDEAGRVIEKTAVDFGDRPLPAALRGRRG